MNKKTLSIIGAIILVAGIAVIVSRGALPPTVEIPVPVATSTAAVATTTPTTTPAVKATPAKPVPVQIQNPDAAQLFALTNADRKSNGDGSLTYSLELQKVAQDRADEIAASGQFSHYVGTSTVYRFTQVLNASGVQWGYGGENLGESFDTMTAAEVAFIASPEHRANILKPAYTQVGIAFSKGICGYQPNCKSDFGKEVQFIVVIFTSK